MADTEAKNLEALEAEAVAEATVADAPKKNAVAAEPTHLSNEAEDLGPAVVKPTDSNPDATKKSKKVSDAVNAKANDGDAAGKPDTDAGVTKVSHPGQSETVEETQVEAKSEDKVEKEVEEEETEKSEKKHMKAGYMKSSYKKEDIDVSEHVDALVNGETDLSEEFKSKAATIFETAIKSKVTEIAEKMDAEYEERFEAEKQTHKDELVEKVDGYLNYVVEQWMKENELAVERGIKGEIAEDFINGLKKLFEEHYIDVPDEKYDVLEDQSNKIEELEKKLNEQIEKNVEMAKENGDFVRAKIISEVASDLADTSKEKFAKLTDEIEYSDADTFKEKVMTVKESYFGKKEDANKSDIDDVAAGESSNEDLSNAMAAYTAAISKTKDIKISN